MQLLDAIPLLETDDVEGTADFWTSVVAMAGFVACWPAWAPTSPEST